MKWLSLLSAVEIESRELGRLVFGEGNFAGFGFVGFAGGVGPVDLESVDALIGADESGSRLIVQMNQVFFFKEGETMDRRT